MKRDREESVSPAVPRFGSPVHGVDLGEMAAERPPGAHLDAPDGLHGPGGLGQRGVARSLASVLNNPESGVGRQETDAVANLMGDGGRGTRTKREKLRKRSWGRGEKIDKESFISINHTEISHLLPRVSSMYVGTCVKYLYIRRIHG